MANVNRFCAIVVVLVTLLCAGKAAAFAQTGSKEAMAEALATVGGTAPDDVGQAEPDLDGVVNINEATEAQLAMLPGIGKSKASAIVAYRATNPFKDPRHLVRVRGIGRETLKRILPYLTVTGPTTLKTKPL